MATKNNIFEDLARVSTNVASLVFESAKNMQEGVKSKTQSFAKSADLVTVDEFEVVKKVAFKAKADGEILAKEISEVKKQLQNIASTLDVLKGQSGKASGGADDSKILDEIRKAGEALDKKLAAFEAGIEAQNQKIEKISKKLEEKPEAAKAESKPVAKKAESNINDLFGNNG
jgi:BMFP domain-containing protein YqiC